MKKFVIKWLDIIPMIIKFMNMKNYYMNKLRSGYLKLIKILQVEGLG
jgi:hypothetical protein